jgi:peptidylprolyl isomerase
VLGALASLLAACGGSSSPSSSTSTKPSASASATAKPGPAVFPTVSGSYGTKPKLTFPGAKPSTALATKVLSEGTGPTVTKGELLIVDYLGQVWGGKTFDNSYDRKQPLGTPIGVGQVISGWDKALVGKKVGSRVLIVVPPAEGYGSQGNSQAGIKGTDTLAFVVDLVKAYPKTVTGDKSAAVQKVSTAPVTVTGALGAEPKISIAKGAAVPKAASAVVLAKSTGAPVKAGLVVLQYEAYYYDNQIADSTFVRGFPLSVSLGDAGSNSPFEKLIGIPLGSRVLLTTPAQDNAGKTTGLAIVVDLIAEPGPAKAS